MRHLCRHRPLWRRVGLLACTLLAACQPATQLLPTPNALLPTTDVGKPPSSPAPTPEALPTLPPEGYWVQPGVPYTLMERLTPVLEEAGLVEVAMPQEAIVRVVLNPGPQATLTAQWVYAPAAPFPTVPDGLSWEGLQGYWLNGSLGGLPDFGAPPQLVLTRDVADYLTFLLGPPAEGLPMQIAAPAALTDAAWNLRPAISILPFDALTPRWKVLTLDGRSVLDKVLDVGQYPLVAQVGLEAEGERGAQIAAGLEARGLWPTTNRDPSRMTVLVMTGVTALVRATAMQMSLRGYDWPAQAILPFFADADILHTSNEVSFAADCPPPDWYGEPSGFCSAPDNFRLLQTIGLDVVELTGNHINDRGTAAFAYTLDLYDANGIVYYGGGRNLEDARTPRILRVPDGTHIAFIGCNVPGPWKAFATAQTPGAAPCDDWSAITEAIRALKAGGEADVVIATLQYWELDSYAPSAEQVADFRRLAEAGADIVSGSQAHQPQGFAFEGGAFIHYGVGNLFFDQMDYLENRQMFADKHILYEGRHISTVLFTGLMEAWAQPNPMTPEDRAAFLQTIFAASGW